MPFFSVLITTFNCHKTIVKTLNSVIQQKMKDFEIIIVDDCSHDNTVHLINETLNDLDISYKLVKLQQNEGVSVARNKGVREASGKYVAFLDGDDIWLPDKLERQQKIILNKRVDWVFSNYYVINDGYESVGKRSRQSGFYDYRNIIDKGNPIGMLTVAIKRDILIRNTFELVHHEDYDLWLRISEKGYIGYLDDAYLASYMKSKNSISSDKLRSVLWTYRVFRKNDENIFQSIRLVMNYVLNAFSRKR